MNSPVLSTRKKKAMHILVLGGQKRVGMDESSKLLVELSQ